MFSNQKLILAGNYAHHYKYDLPIKYGEANPTYRKKNSTNSVQVAEAAQSNTAPRSEKDYSHLYRARKNVRLLLQANAQAFTKSNGTYFRSIFITLTFAENIKNLKQANRRFTRFIKRLNYAVFNTKNSNIRYLAVPEFQLRGAVHYHVIFFNLPFEHSLHSFISKVWKTGFVWIETIKNTDHLTNYVSKYFTKKSQDSRLKGQKAYFGSRGLRQPLLFRGSSSIQQILRLSGKPTFTRIYKNDFVRTIYTCYQVDTQLAAYYSLFS